MDQSQLSRILTRPNPPTDINVLRRIARAVRRPDAEVFQAAGVPLASNAAPTAPPPDDPPTVADLVGELLEADAADDLDEIAVAEVRELVRNLRKRKRG